MPDVHTSEAADEGRRADAEVIDDGARADLPLGRLDQWQRRRPYVALPLAVAYKFFDDQGVYLAVVVTYYAFLSLVPSLLLATSVLGFVLQGDADLQARVLDSALADFPVLGDQLSRPEGLQGSLPAIVAGGLFALYGTLGLGTALQNALHTAWGVPRNSRPNPFLLRLRSLVLVTLGGASVIGLSLVSTLTRAAPLDGPLAPLLELGGPVLSATTVAGVVGVLLWIGAGRRGPLRRAMPGAAVTAVLWQVIQVTGTSLVGRSVQEGSQVNAAFGLVLGSLAITYLAAIAVVVGIETNVVLSRRLWPRALLTPFTDSVALTHADERSYTAYARAQRHKGFQRVEVEFDAMPGEGRSPDPSEADGPVQQ